MHECLKILNLKHLSLKLELKIKSVNIHYLLYDSILYSSSF